jgi:hypothetical protein
MAGLPLRPHSNEAGLPDAVSRMVLSPPRDRAEGRSPSEVGRQDVRTDKQKQIEAELIDKLEALESRPDNPDGLARILEALRKIKAQDWQTFVLVYRPRDTTLGDAEVRCEMQRTRQSIFGIFVDFCCAFSQMLTIADENGVALDPEGLENAYSRFANRIVELGIEAEEVGLTAICMIDWEETGFDAIELLEADCLELYFAEDEEVEEDDDEEEEDDFDGDVDDEMEID